MIIARTDAMAVEGYEKALERVGTAITLCVADCNDLSW